MCYAGKNCQAAAPLGNNNSGLDDTEVGDEMLRTNSLLLKDASQARATGTTWAQLQSCIFPKLNCGMF